MSKSVKEDKTEKTKRKKLEHTKTTVGIIKEIIIVLSTFIAIITGIITLSDYFGSTSITVKNYLNQPVIVKINDSSAYGGLVEAQSTREFTLNSKSDFPVKVEWNMVPVKNDKEEQVGEVLSNIIPKADRGAKIEITNVIGERTYFYPVINNDTDESCNIVINDGLSGSFQESIGYAIAHKKTDLTGYFKYASDSNITLYCNGQPLWHGIWKNEKSQEPLPVEEKSGITKVKFP